MNLEGFERRKGKRHAIIILSKIKLIIIVKVHFSLYFSMCL